MRIRVSNFGIPYGPSGAARSGNKRAVKNDVA